MCDNKLQQIGEIAARLCYENRSGCQDSICSGKCMAVVPFEFLKEAGEIVFQMYWAEKVLTKLTS